MDYTTASRQIGFEIDKICLTKCFPNMSKEVTHKQKICLGKISDLIFHRQLLKKNVKFSIILKRNRKTEWN